MVRYSRPLSTNYHQSPITRSQCLTVCKQVIINSKKTYMYAKHIYIISTQSPIKHDRTLNNLPISPPCEVALPSFANIPLLDQSTVDEVFQTSYQHLVSASHKWLFPAGFPSNHYDLASENQNVDICAPLGIRHIALATYVIM